LFPRWSAPLKPDSATAKARPVSECPTTSLPHEVRNRDEWLVNFGGSTRAMSRKVGTGGGPRRDQRLSGARLKSKMFDG
jgi:hypothetical protein